MAKDAAAAAQHADTITGQNTVLEGVLKVARKAKIAVRAQPHAAWCDAMPRVACARRQHWLLLNAVQL